MIKRSYFKAKPRKPLKRTKLKIAGHSTTKELKDEIQSLIREIALKRDKHCVLKDKGAGNCGCYKTNGELILQAEHLNSRTHTATFGDMRNIVLLCKYHHIFWKPKNSARYWELIKEIIGEERYAWYQKVREDRTAHKIDLKLVLLDLKQQLKSYE